MRNRYTVKQIQKWKDSLVTLPQAIKNKETEIAEKTRQYSELEPSLHELKENKIPNAKLLIEKLTAKIELPSIPNRIQLFEVQAKSLREQSNSLDAPIKIAENSIAPIESEINRINRLIKIKFNQRQIIELTDRIDALSRSQTQDERELSQLGYSHTLQLSNLHDNRQTLNNLKSSKKTIVARLDLLHSLQLNVVTTDGFSSSVSDVGGYTSSGVQVVHDHHAHERQAEIHTLEAQLADYTTKIDHCQSRVITCESQCNATQSRINSLESNISLSKREIRKSVNDKDTCRQQLNHYDEFEKISAISTSNQHLEQELRNQKEKLDILHKELVSLREKKLSLERKHSDAINEQHRLQARQAECYELIKDFSVTDDVEQLKLKLEEEQKNLRRLQSEKTRIEDIDREAQQCKKDLLKLEDNYQDVNNNQYLQTLDKNPQQLLTKLSTELQQALNDYEISHPSGQDTNTRKCLAELRHKGIGLINNVPVQPLEKYYMLCGYTYYWQKKVRLTQLEDVLEKVLREQLIDLDEVDYVAELRMRMPVEFTDISDVDLLTYEASIYTTACADFKNLLAKVNANALPELRQVSNAGLAMLVEMKDKEDQSKKDSSKPFDYKYYTNVLTMAGQLLAKPNDRGLHFKFRDLVSLKKNEDKASIGYKIGGIALMFLGAVVAAAGAVVGFLGFPIGAPLYCTVPTMVLGAGLIATGIGLFCHGFNKGLTGKINQFDKISDKYQDKLMASDTKPLMGPGSYS